MKDRITSATFDITGRYRYLLTRIEDMDKPLLVFIMLNPSTANSTDDDPTIRRCENFAKVWGYGGIKVVNLFALVSSDPKKLLTEPDAIGEDNDAVIISAAYHADEIIVAWGTFKQAEERSKEVLNLLSGRKIYCLGITKGGAPKHPLYLRNDTKPTVYRTEGAK